MGAQAAFPNLDPTAYQSLTEEIPEKSVVSSFLTQTVMPKPESLRPHIDDTLIPWQVSIANTAGKNSAQFRLLPERHAHAIPMGAVKANTNYMRGKKPQNISANIAGKLFLQYKP